MTSHGRPCNKNRMRQKIARAVYSAYVKKSYGRLKQYEAGGVMRLGQK